MSDTPRTDGVMREGPIEIEAGAAWLEMRDLARRLERELNEAREELCELRKWQADHRADVEAKDAKIDALERSLNAKREVWETR